jgi:predicted RNA-binding Zn-ribbon protein involved in translation (DUF1610 family)
MARVATTLPDLPGSRVVSCEETVNVRRAVVMQTADEHACPRCGVLVDGNAYDVRESRRSSLTWHFHHTAATCAVAASPKQSLEEQLREQRGVAVATYWWERDVQIVRCRGVF